MIFERSTSVQMFSNIVTVRNGNASTYGIADTVPSLDIYLKINKK